MAQEIKFLSEQKNENNFIIRILFSLKLSNREEDNLSYSLKNTNSKNISESCINDDSPECKCVNGPIKSDIALYKKIETNNYKQNTDED